MITYKRKRAASHAHTEDVLDSSPAASSNVVVSSLQLKSEGPSETAVINEDNHTTPKKRQCLSMLLQENIKEEYEPEKGQDQFYDSLARKEQPEICSATIASTAEAHSNKSQCIDDTNNQIPVSSSVCNIMLADGTNNQTKDSNISAPVEINSPTGTENAVVPGQCKKRFSPLLTFRRRIKKKTNLDEPAEEICSPDNDKQCSTLTCSPPRSSLNATPLVKHTTPNPLDIEDKVTLGNAGPSTQAEHSPEQESSHTVKSSVQHVVAQIAQDVNQNMILEDDVTPVSNQKMTLEDDVTPMSKFSGAKEASGQDTQMEDLNRTSPVAIEVPKVIDVRGKGHCTGETTSLQSPRQKLDVSWLKPTNKYVVEDVPESQGSTKNVPVIVLDDDNDERGKELENSEALDQGLHNQNKRTSFGKIDLNCNELRQQGLLFLDDSTIQRLPDQDLDVNARKQMSQPIERLFFTKEKDTLRGKQQQHEESSPMHTSYSSFFDLGLPRSTGNLKGPKSLPSELKFRIMDRAPEFSLDLSLDSFTDVALRSDKLLTSHKLKEKLGTYSYKRQSAPWSEEELDFLWIGVRRYGVNNWNAMLRDTRLRFSNSRMPEDLAKQWDKEQKKLVASALGPAPPLHMGEDYLGRASCSGCSKSAFLGAQTDLSLGDVYLHNARASDRDQHHLSSLGVLNFHGIDGGPRNMSLGGFPGASSSYGRSGSRRRRASKLHKSYYENKSPWFQEPSDRVPQLLTNQQPINSLPQWLTKDAETGTSRINPETWPSMVPPPGRSAADPPRGGSYLFCNDAKPHVLPDASLKRTMRRNADWRSFSKRLFLSSDALDLNRGAKGTIVPKGATPSDTGASSEETVSDS